MRTHRAFSDTVGLPELTLEGDEARHLGRVLRVRPGDAVEVFDGQGGAGRYAVVEVARRTVTLTRSGDAPPGPRLPAPLHVAVAAPKGKRAQRLVEGLTELGVDSVRWLDCARSQGKQADPEQVRRWALEACKQCRRNHLPEVGPPLAIDALGPDGRCLIGAPGDAQPIAAAVAAPEPTWLVIGPEGGLTDDEVAALRDRGATPVRLGPAILRVETAALGLTAAVIAQWEAR